MLGGQAILSQRIGAVGLISPPWYTASPVPFSVLSWNVSLQASLPAWKVGGEGGQCAYVSFLLLWHLSVHTHDYGSPTTPAYTGLW